MAEKKTTTTKAKKTTAKPAAKKVTAPKAEKASKPVKKAFGKTAILAINNMQYVIREGETVDTRIALDSTDKDVDVKLLALLDGDKFEYGTPYLANKVDFKLGEMVKGEKVFKQTFKAKARQRKKVGHRPKFIEFTLNSVK